MNNRTAARSARALATTAFLLLGLGSGQAIAQVQIFPGQNIQSVINSQPAGTTFILKSGVHRGQTIRPRSGDKFVGEAGAVLSGSQPVTTFERASGGGTTSTTSYLSDRNWSYMTNGWGPIERDRSSADFAAGDGRTITLNGQGFSKGLGAHAPSDVRFTLGGSCTTFNASVGVDDEVGGNGYVAFQVWADGALIYQTGAMSGSTGTQAVQVDVSGRNELRLVVDAGSDAYYDHADWADARVTCNSAGSGLWIATGQTQQGLNSHGVCQPGYPRCTYPEQFFIDNQGLVAVSSLNDLGPGKFFFDYNADRIYFADDPTGRVVEASVTASGFLPTGDNVTVSDLVIERYSNIAQNGVIDAQGRTGWVITNNIVGWNHGAGIRAGAGAVVRNNYIHHNGELGIAGSGASILIESNEIAYNNLARYLVLWEGGGTKFSGTSNLVVRGNYSHHNLGHGLHTDMDNINVLYENNTVDDNEWIGIVHEISYSAIIRNNVTRRNGWAYPGWIHGGGIVVASSPNVEVYGNYVEGNADGIGASQQARGSGAYGAYEVWNLWVHDNVLVDNGGWTGMVQDAGDRSLFTSRNNRFDRNQYKLGPQSWPFAWMDSEQTENGWRNFGQDANGTFSR